MCTRSVCTHTPTFATSRIAWSAGSTAVICLHRNFCPTAGFRLTFCFPENSSQAPRKMHQEPVRFGLQDRAFSRIRLKTKVTGMKTTSHDLNYDSQRSNRKAFLLLRWLIIILAGYLTMFENIDDEGIVGLFLIVVAFVLSNVLIALAPLAVVMAAKRRHLIAATDAVFICAFLYYLRVEQVQIHLPFMGIVVLAIIWPDLRVVLLAMFVVSLLFGLFTNFELFGATIEIARDEFLTLSLLFIVAIFYVFMVERFDRDSATSAALLREKRNSEKVNEITRQISASLQAKEILAILIKRFRELMPDVECSILRIEGGSDEAIVIAGSHAARSPTMNVEQVPLLGEAFTLKEPGSTTIKRDGGTVASMAVPMISRGEVVAVLYFGHAVNGADLLDENRNFIQVVASAAASALSNAEQFESLKELATSESTTKLANHGTFQTQLEDAVERARRDNGTVSLLMVDLDWLKKINEEHGYAVGDGVIGAVAQAIRTNCREIDFPARYGGEEFAVILPETDLREAVLVAEGLRQRVEAIDQFGMSVTVSIGVANSLDAGTAQELILAAENALYFAKGQGRNRVSPSPTDVANS